MDYLAAKAPFGDDKRVQLGFFFDSHFLPENVIAETLTHVKEAGVKLIVSHYRHWPVSKGTCCLNSFCWVYDADIHT